MDDLVYIVPKPFKRGSDRFDNEGPVRYVVLSPFWIGRYPVTNHRYAEFIAAGGYATSRYWIDEGFDYVKNHGLVAPLYWDDEHFNQPMQPVTGVSWWEAMAYAAFRGMTLPTEAQWEYAAGLGARVYPWGDEEPSLSRANYAPACEPAELRRSTTPVDAHPEGVSASGCWDMAGNVHEWCLDKASTDYGWDTTGFDPMYDAGVNRARIVRGGSGLHDEDCLRCSSRDFYEPELRDNIVGIRLARTAARHE